MKLEKVTIIMPTFKRNDYLSRVDHPSLNVAKESFVDKLLIIWQNIGEKVPENVISNLESVCPGKYEIVFPEKNSLNNRFKPFDQIKTDLVMNLDDDYNVTRESVVSMIEIMMKNNDNFVGSVPRNIYTDENGAFKYEYSPEFNNESYNFLLTGYSMFHRKYLDIYHSKKDEMEMVDSLFNSEDILFNHVYEKHSTTGEKFLVSDINVKTWQYEKGRSISDRSDHLLNRQKMCLFLKTKGYSLPVKSNRRVSLNNKRIKIKNAYWINLEKSKDRRENFEREVISVLKERINFFRFPAVDLTAESYIGRRSAGCSFSHLSCWNHAINSGEEYVIIFEDDFKPICDPEVFSKTIDDLVDNHPGFLLCNIAYNQIKDPRDVQLHTGFKNFHNIQTTSGYIVKTDFLKQLYPYVLQGAMNLLLGGQTNQNAIDVVWKMFQGSDRWLCSKKLGVQRESFSEIEKRIVKYEV
jgi:hypothetical protein